MANFRRCLGVYGFCLGMVLWVVSLAAMGQTVSTEATLQQYYLAYYGRAADPGGLDQWRALVDAAGSDAERSRILDNVRASFGSPAQAEFAAVYGQVDDATFLDRAYTNILNRTFDSAGRAYWAGEIDSRTQAFMQWGDTPSDAQAKARADVLSLIINAALAGGPSSLDRRTIERSVELARYITQIVRDRGSEVAGLLDATRELLAEADLGQQSLASLQARVGDLIRESSGRGHLQVTLEPAAARDAGAQWRRTGTSTWRNSGSTEIDIPVGGQTVEFKVIPNWIAPSNAAVSITAGQVTTLARSYERETTDPIDPLPPATGRLNDTGIDWCADGGSNFLACPVASYPGQDGDSGRDALALAGLLDKVGAGAAGFDYTKLDAQGNALSASALNWSCVRDNHTGLIWEVKVDDPGHLRHKDHTYTWYNPDPHTNGGSAGTGTVTGCNNTLSSCNTYVLVQAVNAQGLCGANDWRMPTVDELRLLAHRGRMNPPAIDTDYFPNTASSGFWSASPSAGNSADAWNVYFSHGHDRQNGKSSTYQVRLVRGGQ